MAKGRPTIFGDLLKALGDETVPLPAALIYRLSDVADADYEALCAVWSDLPVERRRLLLSRMVEASETNFEMDFERVALFALDDEDEEVRAQAIAGLWENETIGLMERLLSLMLNDPGPQARAASAGALGRFVLLGELGKLPPDRARQVEDALLEVCYGEDDTLEVQRRALESVAYSGREEVAALIEDAYYHDDTLTRASAVFAIGRSADDRWASLVLAELHSAEPPMRFEAARACGELELEDAVPTLIKMLAEQDREVREAAIWALGEIGGREARAALLAAADQAEDEVLLEMIEDAISSSTLAEGGIGIPFFPDFEDTDDEI
jgi:HEAT repeat protein